MRKKIDPDIRKVTFTVSLAPALVRRLDEEAARCNLTRSALIRSAIGLYFRYAAVYGPDPEDMDFLPPVLPDEPSDDVSEIGYNPYTGAYEEDI